jgi:N-methylhydantoinase B
VNIYAIPVIAGLMYRDSVEIDELKHRFRVEVLGFGGGFRRRWPAPRCARAGSDLHRAGESGSRRHPVLTDNFPAAHAASMAANNGTAGSTHLIDHNGHATKLPKSPQ